MPHYFTNDEIDSQEKEISIKIKDTNLKFITDRGTFSKKGLDFGTRSLLESIDLSTIEGDVLDFGCGWGPIGIYISKMTKACVDMIDINDRALNLSKKNATLNGVKVNVYKSNIYENVDKKYNFIITNPPIRVGKKKLYEILFKSIDHLKQNGEMYLVVSKDQGAKSLMKDLKEKAETSLIKKNKGFYIIKVQKR